MVIRSDPRSTTDMMTGALLGRSSRTVVITCTQCGQRLAEAIPGSVVYCSECRRWSGTVERPRLPRRHSPLDVNRGVAG